MTILNLTQHAASDEQLAAGVVDLPVEQKALLVEQLTVDTLPGREEILARCAAIAQLALAVGCTTGCTTAMIGGAPWMMAALENALLSAGIQFVYAFSTRDSIEQVQPDGSVKKINVFRHAGFIAA